MTCSVLVLAYIVLRGFKLDNTEFACLTILLGIVLIIGIFAYRHRSCTYIYTSSNTFPNAASASTATPSSCCKQTTTTKEGFDGADTPHKQRSNNSHVPCYQLPCPFSLRPRTSTWTNRNESAAFSTAFYRLMRSLVTLIQVVLYMKVVRPTRRAAADTLRRLFSRPLHEPFMVNYHHTMVTLPRRVRVILEPKIKRIAKGFEGEGSDSSPVYVGDGKQEQYDDRPMEERNDGVKVEEYYEDKNSFSRLWKSDEEYQKAKEKLLEKRRKEREEREKNLEKSRKESEPKDDDIPAFVKNSNEANKKRKGEEQKRKEEERERKRREGREEEEEEKDGEGGGGGLRFPMRDEGVDQKVQEQEEAAARARKEEEEDGEMKDEDGIPLRFDMDKFREMLREYQHADYALCRLKHSDRDMYKRLMRLDWLDTYLKMKSQ